jgi:DNA-binding NarL/FixJ family response regulator
MKPADHHRRPQRSPIQVLDQPDSSSIAGHGLSEGFGPRETRIGPAAPIRTMVINDSLGLLFEISRLLMAQPAIELIGMTSDEDAVWDEMANLQPELIVWTLKTRRTERLEKISALRRLLPSLRIVIIGADNQPELIDRCQDHGVDSFIPRSRLRYDLWPAIQRQFTRPQQLDN